MFQEQRFEELSPDQVAEKAAELKKEGWRMVQICGITQAGQTELIYTYDKDFEMVNYKTAVPFGSSVKSITKSYWPAFVYENEIHDLFGVQFEDLAVDYKGNFFRTGLQTPWKGPEQKEAQRWEKGPSYRSGRSILPCRNRCTSTWR